LALAWATARIARPSTFDTDNKLLVFALRGLSDGDDAAVLALAAYSAALRRTLSYPESIFFIDEFSILLEWPEISQLVARLTANGAKAGMFSKWLLDKGGTQTFIRYYSPPILLAVVANNPHETVV
jgi:hypothetical protein